MSHKRIDELEKVAGSYHLNNDVPDKFIEDLCQVHCCEWLESLISQDDRVVELGYGEGITLDQLSKVSRKYSLVEGAPSLVAKARSAYPEIEVIEALFEDYVPSQKFDKILALHVFEHVDDPVSLARHLSTWLNPDGEIVVVVPNKASLHRRLAVAMNLTESLDALSERDLLVGHQRVYGLDDLKEDLGKAGFKCFSEKGFFAKLLPNSMMLDFSIQLIEGLNLLGDELPVALTANIAVRAKLSCDA